MRTDSRQGAAGIPTQPDAAAIAAALHCLCADNAAAEQMRDGMMPDRLVVAGMLEAAYAADAGLAALVAMNDGQEQRIKDLVAENGRLREAEVFTKQGKLRQAVVDQLLIERDALAAQVATLREAASIHLVGLDEADRNRCRAVSFRTWGAVMRGAEDLRAALSATTGDHDAD